MNYSFLKSNTFVFLIIKQIIKNLWIPLLLSLIFAVHPIHVESVAPVFNYMGILALFFALSLFWAFIKSDSIYLLSQHDEAIKYFEKVNSMDKDYPWGYYNLGLVYQKKNQKEKIREFFEKVLKLDSDLINAKAALEAL